LANFWNIGHYNDRLQWEINIYSSYSFCFLLCDASFRSLDAEKNNASITLRFAFGCCVFVELADIIQTNCSGNSSLPIASQQAACFLSLPSTSYIHPTNKPFGNAMDFGSNLQNSVSQTYKNVFKNATVRITYEKVTNNIRMTKLLT